MNELHKKSKKAAIDLSNKQNIAFIVHISKTPGQKISDHLTKIFW